MNSFRRGDGELVLISAAVGGVLGIAVVLGAPFGDLAGWAQAIGTVLAFWAAYRLLRHEVHARQADEADRAAEQARRVAVWPNGVEVRFPPSFREDGTAITDDEGNLVSSDPYRVAKVVIWNGSDAPIFWVAVYTGDYRGTAASPRGTMHWGMHVLKPGETEVELPMLTEYEYPEMANMPPPIEITFNDARDRAWHWKAGVLSPLPSNPYEGGC